MVKETRKQTTAEPVVEEPVSAEPVPAVEIPIKHWNIGGLFWGLLLVTVGVLLLLANFDVVHLDWGNVLQIWPVAIIAAGVSLLSVRSAWWKAVSVLLMLGTLVAIVLLAIGKIGSSTDYRTYTAESQQSSANVTKAEVTLKAGASKVNVTSANLDTAAKATLKSNVASLKEQSNTSGDTQYVKLTSESSRRLWFMGSFMNEWNVTLDEDRPTRLFIDSGASQIDADVSRVMLDQLTLKAGASSSVITIGNKTAKTLVNIDSGASTVLVRVPKSSGVSIKVDGGLATKQLADLKQVSENYYETDGYAAAGKQIVIEAKIGAANFSIERY